ncbi:SRPBCC family protein [Mycobacterium sp. DL99]|uniref:SRPBCC family protein n=1 Tax=Mycobacterium sp. DL99 TaxID=2528957 RepID=UPI001081FE8F|nr:SRPBCC family protein [Mycobacterium sp. DL99]
MDTQSAAESQVVRSVTVPLSRQRTFELFATRMGEYWPREHSIATVPREDMVIEPRVGGRCFELGEDGSECDWGRVAVWEPPSRLVLLWQINADWKFDPDFETEVEVTFSELEPGRTRLDLTHRNLDRYGDRAAEIRSALDSPDGWTAILDAFVRCAIGAAPQ